MRAREREWNRGCSVIAHLHCYFNADQKKNGCTPCTVTRRAPERLATDQEAGKRACAFDPRAAPPTRLGAGPRPGVAGVTVVVDQV